MKEIFASVFILHTGSTDPSTLGNYLYVANSIRVAVCVCMHMFGR